jgi:hypothetical protein
MASIGNPQCHPDEFLILPGKGTVLEGMSLHFFEFTESVDATAEHLQVVLFPGPSDVRDVVKHVVLHFSEYENLDKMYDGAATLIAQQICLGDGHLDFLAE